MVNRRLLNIACDSIPMEPIKDIHIKKDMSAGDLVKQMEESGGFSAKNVGLAADIMKDMVKDKDCIKFLSFPACIIATGTRGVIKDMVKQKTCDVIITTCGTLDHDLARLWKDYYHGSFEADDAKLRKQGVNRLGNIFVPNESYGIILEKKMAEMLPEIYKEKKEYSTCEIIWKFGEMLSKEKNHEDSIIYWAWKNKIPIIIPGITDGSFGSQLWMFWQDHKDFKINMFKDEQMLSDMVFTAKKSGALIIGGGISKHHVIWWNQFKDGLDYAIYITTAVEWDGSLSGAKIKEAVSWGKVSEKAKKVSIEGDATVLLPLIFAGMQ